MGRARSVLLMVVVASSLLAVVLPVGVSAAPKALLSSVGGGTAGHGGVFNGARGIAVNHASGDFYVADGTNHRIQQFTADGGFVRAWGFDVVAGNAETGFEVCEVAAQCKAGAMGAAAGQLQQPFGVAIDQSNGFVYVTTSINRRVDVFSGSGEFAGAFGWGVDTGADALEVCTTASTCQIAGAAGADAGRFSNLSTSYPAIDPSAAPGTVYVPDQGNARVAKYKTEISGGVLQSASFVKAFGWDVAPGAVDEEQEVRVRATGGQFTLTFGGDTTVALDQDATAGDVQTALNALASISTGGGSVTVSGGPGDETGSELYVVRFGGGPLAGANVAQLTAADGAVPLSGGDPSSGVSVQTRAQGGTTTGLESCTTASGCKAGTNGGGAGQFFGVVGGTTAGQAGSPRGAAVDSTGAVYVSSGPLANPNNACTAVAPCRVQKFDPSTSTASDFGPVSGDGLLTHTAGTVGAVAGLDVAVDPANDHLYVNQKTASTSYQVREYDSSGALVETHPGAALTSAAGAAVNGLAAGAGGRVYTNATGASINLLGPVPDPISTIGAVTDVSATKATFSGTVEVPAPGAPIFATMYRFEYSANGVDWTKVPDPGLPVGDGTTGVHGVTSLAGGLQPNTLYSVRLVASTGGEPVASATTTFATSASAPRLAMTYVDEVTKTSARLGAHIDPEGLSTTYRFEWGTESCSEIPNPCANVPATGRQLGDGSSIVVATENIDNLAKTTTYHYRVIAHNTAGTTTSPDQTFETLNDCGLPNNRCYELVSSLDKGPVGRSGGFAAVGGSLQFQAATEGPGVAYNMGYGAPDATAGTEVLYQAEREPSGWSSFQLTPSSLTVPVMQGTSDTSIPLALAPDLGCGFFVSNQMLAQDAPREVLDAGGAVLYLREADGVWRTVMTTVPSNIEASAVSMGNQYFILGMSDRCDRAIIRTQFHYPGTGGVGNYRVYEWHDGVLSSVGVIPGPSGPVEVEVTPGAFGGTSVEVPNFAGAVSRGASRVVLQAVRQTSPKPAEVGVRGVFVRDSGQTAVDVSLSHTAIPNSGHSRYETATGDGDHVFFTARHGLAANSATSGPSTCSVDVIGQPNGPGCDLYRYSTVDATLVSVTGASASQTPGGAGVAGIVDVSDDGSHVYFASRGQLVPGEGKSEAANVSDDTYSIYLSVGGTPTSSPELRFVGTLGQDGTGAVSHAQVVASARTRTNVRSWAVKVTPDGRRMVFASAAGGSPEAYLYDADADTTICLSCRRDRQPSSGPAGVADKPLPQIISMQSWISPPVVLTDDGRRVFFYSKNRLATGGIEGQRNLYQWEDGQVSFLGTSTSIVPATTVSFAGASVNGDEVYFATIDRYTWQDTDDRMDVYAARVGGGFPKPLAGPEPCDPLAASCQNDDRADPVESRVDTSQTGDGNTADGPRAVFSVGGLSRVQRTSLAAGRQVGLLVRVSRPGVVRVRGTAVVGGLRARVLSGAVRAPRAGRYRVAVVLSRPAVRKLRRSRSLPVVLSVRFDGARSEVLRRISLKRPPRGRTANNDQGASR